MDPGLFVLKDSISTPSCLSRTLIGRPKKKKKHPLIKIDAAKRSATTFPLLTCKPSANQLSMFNNARGVSGNKKQQDRFFLFLLRLFFYFFFPDSVVGKQAQSGQMSQELAHGSYKCHNALKT